MIYIVLGMHKSGTSLVAEILHKSGISMAQQLDLERDYDSGNKYECPLARSLNIGILSAQNVSSLSMVRPKDLVLDERNRHRMIEIVRERETQNLDWGFKDPRTCFTYPLWQSVLPEHKVIATFRHPVQVGFHYRAGQNVRRWWRVLRAWSRHNASILDSLQKLPNTQYLILNFEAMMSTQEEWSRLSDFVGRPLVDCRRMNSYRWRDQQSRISSMVERVSGWDLPRASRVMSQLTVLRSAQLLEELERTSGQSDEGRL